MRPIFSPFRRGLEQHQLALYIQKNGKNKGKCDEPLLRKVKTIHGSYSLLFDEFNEYRTKSGEFWLRGDYKM